MNLQSKVAIFIVLYLGLLSFYYDQVSAAPQKNYPHYQMATPIPIDKRLPPMTRYEQGLEDYDEESSSYHKQTSYPVLKEPDFSPPSLIMTVLKTIVDVLKKVNTNRKKTEKFKTNSTLNTAEKNVTLLHKIDTNLRPVAIANNTNSSARGYEDDIGVISYVDDHHYHMEAAPPPPPPPSTAAPMTDIKPRYSDPWEGYYDFIITEGSFKFWSGFQLFTALLLLYSALAAIYYAKYNPIQPDYDTTYDDYFFGRSLEGSAPDPDPSRAYPAPGWITSIKDMSSTAYAKILDVISQPHAPNSD